METYRITPTYKQCFLSLAVGFSPFFILMGLAAILGRNTVTFNNEYVHGIAGLLVALILNLVFAAITAGLQKLGYWILGLVGARKADPA